jgi:uncharacterized protein
MLLALLSDTHDHAAATQAALDLLAPYRPDAYLHAGDLVSPDFLGHFAGIGPFHFVFGNNEFDHAALRSQAHALDLVCHGPFADLTFGGKRIALLHGHDSILFHRLADSGQYHYIIHGHTHVRRDVRLPAPSPARIINPGALFRARAKSVALLDVVADTVRFLEVPS